MQIIAEHFFFSFQQIKVLHARHSSNCFETILIVSFICLILGVKAFGFFTGKFAQKIASKGVFAPYINSLTEEDIALMQPLRDCDVKSWLRSNLLNLNESKTEAILFGP